MVQSTPLPTNLPEPYRPVKTIRERIDEASTAQKVAFCIGVAIVGAFIILFFVFERQIFEFLEPAVSFIRKSDAGIAVLSSIMAATCIFPLLGYGVVSMICGYIYGIPKGFLPAFVGDIVGASICFWLYRFAFHDYINRKLGHNIEFKEMSKAVSKDGLFILFLVRLSSFPFAVLNAYFGAMTLLPYWKFILATTLSTPRLFIPIFIGHNISSLADPTIVGKDRVLKWGMNVLGIIIALAVGWYIYRHTVRRIKRINAGLSPDEGEEEENIGLGRQQQQQQQQHQQSSGSNEHTDNDSFDMGEVRHHEYVGDSIGHVAEVDSSQGYSQPGHYTSNFTRGQIKSIS